MFIEQAARLATEPHPIGTLSVTLRMNAFLAVSRHLDNIVDRHELSPAGAALAINIMRLSDKAFMKAVTMFDERGPRMSADARTDLPAVARSTWLHSRLRGAESRG